MPQLFTNNARALLASGITNVATSLTVEAAKADLFPTADTGTAAVPASTNWFKLTLQDVDGNVEIIYVRTRSAGSAVMSNILRGQEGTTARAFAAGTVVGLRITAADVEGSIAAAANSVQLTGNQTIAGTKTFSSTISGSITGNAGTVTNGVYTTGDQTIGGSKTFSSTTTGKSSGSDANAGFIAASAGGTFASMWSRRGAPFSVVSNTTGSSYAPGYTHNYTHNSGWDGVYSLGVLNSNTTNPGKFAIHHIDSGGGGNYNWTFSGIDGGFVSQGNITAYSDIRLKTDLVKIVDALGKVCQLNGYTYTRIDGGQRQTGVVAQQVQAVIPEAVVEDDDGMLSVAYGNLVGLLVEAIKELDARVKDLEAR